MASQNRQNRAIIECSLLAAPWRIGRLEMGKPDMNKLEMNKPLPCSESMRTI
jgi:hypothetical protein